MLFVLSAIGLSKRFNHIRERYSMPTEPFSQEDNQKRIKILKRYLKPTNGDFLINNDKQANPFYPPIHIPVIIALYDNKKNHYKAQYNQKNVNNPPRSFIPDLDSRTLIRYRLKNFESMNSATNGLLRKDHQYRNYIFAPYMRGPLFKETSIDQFRKIDKDYPWRFALKHLK